MELAMIRQKREGWILVQKVILRSFWVLDDYSKADKDC
jgi:hypothetical protein